LIDGTCAAIGSIYFNIDSSVSDRTYRGYKLKVAIRYYSKGTGVEVRTTPVSGVVTKLFVFLAAVEE
jgi:hypothetical protein